jgi:ABC-type Fe3+ transport system permease subunit
MTQNQSKKAIWSLTLGGLSICLGLFTAVPAIILGVLALRDVQRNPTRRGESLAVAGMALGAIGIVVAPMLVAIAVALALPAFHAAHEAHRREESMRNLRLVGEALKQYEELHPTPSEARKGDK